MVPKPFELTLQLVYKGYQDTEIRVVSNDTGVNNLTIYLYDGTTEVTYTDIDSGIITFIKDDGNIVQGNLTINADSITYTMGTNEIAIPGVVKASIQLYGASEERLTPAKFKFYVEKDDSSSSAIDSTTATTWQTDFETLENNVLSMCYNVKRYGALGDGSTDDTDTIQDAINAAEAAGGGMVYFPKGEYIITDTIEITTDDITIVNANIIFETEIESISAFNFSGTDGISSNVSSIDGLKIYISSVTGFEAGDIVRVDTDELYNEDRPSYFKFDLLRVEDVGADYVEVTSPLFHSYDTGGYTVTLTKINMLKNPIIDGVKIYLDKDKQQSGIDFDKCYNITIKNCYISDAGHNAISIANSLLGVVENNYIERTESLFDLDYGITVTRSSNVDITSNKIYSHRTAINVTNLAYNINITSNTIMKGSIGPHLGFNISICNNILKDGSIYLRTENTVVANNIIHSNNTWGIFIVAQYNITISSNQIYFPADDIDRYGVRISYYGAKYITIDNNVIHNCNIGIYFEHGINKPDVRYISISGNKIIARKADSDDPVGINIIRVEDVIVKGNTIINSSYGDTSSDVGIAMWASGDLSHSNYTITNNQIYGFSVGVSATSALITDIICKNNIIKNHGTNAINIIGSTNIINSDNITDDGV
jgi:parallel beta-helix repeat protein